MMTLFQNRLKELREEKGLTQNELAQELGVSRGSISFYENGDRTPDIEFLNKACTFFDVPTDYLLGHIEVRENTNLGLVSLGLSDAAISFLKRGWANDFLSLLLGDARFQMLVSNIQDVYNDPEWSSIEYFSKFGYTAQSLFRHQIVENLTAIIENCMEHYFYEKNAVYKILHDYLKDNEYDRKKILDIFKPKLQGSNLEKVETYLRIYEEKHLHLSALNFISGLNTYVATPEEIKDTFQPKREGD